jgi:short-subunit dehydrogenase
MRGFSEALSRELTGTGVDVLYIAPRTTRTTMNDTRADALNRALGNTEDPPEWVAAEIVKAIGRGRRRTYLGWPENFFIRINNLLPGIVDRSLAGVLPVIKKHIPVQPT